MSSDPIEQAEAARADLSARSLRINDPMTMAIMVQAMNAIAAVIDEHKRVVAQAEGIGSDARYWKGRYEHQSENLLRVVAERDAAHATIRDALRVGTGQDETLDRREVMLETLRARVEEDANSALSQGAWREVGAILSASLPPTTDNHPARYDGKYLCATCRKPITTRLDAWVHVEEASGE